MIALLLLTCVISAGHAASTHNLTFMMIASYGQYGFNSSGALPAADMALEDINSDPDILTGYNLMYDKVRDSMVGPTLNSFSTEHREFSTHGPNYSYNSGKDNQKLILQLELS